MAIELSGILRSAQKLLIAHCVMFAAANSTNAWADNQVQKSAYLVAGSMAQSGSELRLEAIGYRLAVANSSRCAEPLMMTGFMVHDIGRYSKTDRAGVIADYGLSSGFGILNVVPGSSAERAGIRERDEIISVNDTQLMNFGIDLIRK